MNNLDVATDEALGGLQVESAMQNGRRLRDGFDDLRAMTPSSGKFRARKDFRDVCERLGTLYSGAQGISEVMETQYLSSSDVKATYSITKS